MIEFTALEKYQAVLRELKYRRRVYPRLVANDVMTQEVADREIAVLTAIGQDYERECQKERLL